MRAKRAEERVGESAKVLRAIANLKAKGMIGRRIKVTVDQVDFVERRERDLNIEIDAIKVKLFKGKSATKILNVRGRRLTVKHSFIEGDMTSSHDLTTGSIDVVGMAHGLFVAEKNTGTSVDVNFSITVGRGKSINPAAKNAKEADVDTFASANGNS